MAASPLKDIHILIVDDDSDVLLTLCELFATFGFTVHTAGDAFGAFSVVEEHPIRLVLSDIRMPNSNGVDLIRMLRVRNVDEPKFLFVSGFADYKLEELYELGAEGYFAKPFNPQAVRQAIRHTLLRRSERWKPNPQARSLPDLGVEKVVPETLRLGRGGFFLGLEGATAIPLGTEIKFSLDYKPGTLLVGAGVIRWSRSQANKHGAPGIGVEITELADSCRDQVIHDIESDLPVPFIPIR